MCVRQADSSRRTQNSLLTLGVAKALRQTDRHRHRDTFCTARFRWREGEKRENEESHISVDYSSSQLSTAAAMDGFMETAFSLFPAYYDISVASEKIVRSYTAE